MAGRGVAEWNIVVCVAAIGSGHRRGPRNPTHGSCARRAAAASVRAARLAGNPHPEPLAIWKRDYRVQLGTLTLGHRPLAPAFGHRLDTNIAAATASTR